MDILLVMTCAVALIALGLVGPFILIARFWPRRGARVIDLNRRGFSSAWE